jgi:RNA polymerase sigma-70 factor (ECF subfamily)
MARISAISRPFDHFLLLFCFLVLRDPEYRVALSDLDRGLIKDCVEGDPQAWRSFCDRFAGLVMDVVDDTLAFAGVSGPQRSEGLRQGLAEEFFQELRSNGFSLIRSFRGESSLATYLAVVARRSILGYLSKRNLV